MKTNLRNQSLLITMKYPRYPLGDNFQLTPPEKYPEWLKLHNLEAHQILQRHAILHGVQKDYASKENSLRAFLLMDVLCWISLKLG